ncbi:hypothetical protein J6590_010042 [Homalodisca vitripennis]|nr:hypothetical protein J6590_010042 [Homalodisca vitripennis]
MRPGLVCVGLLMICGAAGLQKPPGPRGLWREAVILRASSGGGRLSLNKLKNLETRTGPVKPVKYTSSTCGKNAKPRYVSELKGHKTKTKGGWAATVREAAIFRHFADSRMDDKERPAHICITIPV